MTTLLTTAFGIVVCCSLQAIAGIYFQVRTNLDGACDNVSDIRYITLSSGDGECFASHERFESYIVECSEDNKNIRMQVFNGAACSGVGTATSATVPTACGTDSQAPFNLFSISCGMPDALASSSKKFPYLFNIFSNGDCSKKQKETAIGYDGNCLRDNSEEEASRLYVVEGSTMYRQGYSNSDCSGEPASVLEFKQDACIPISNGLFAQAVFDPDRTAAMAVEEMNGAAQVMTIASSLVFGVLVIVAIVL
eukprot:m.298824 g.298824  ORF g.298824 m.298824 type:complete len:251 (+) comp96903_c0_seq1:144-896(+)